MQKFKDKTVMITGAGRNMGRRFALDFAREGANIVVCDYLAENAKSTMEEIYALNSGSQAMEAIFDVRDRFSVFAYVDKAIERFGKIDILVNNAGGSSLLLNKITSFIDAEAETLDFVIDINLRGTMNCTQAVLRSMIEQRCGKIINIASIAGVCGMANRVDYSAAKGGIIAFTKALALEVGRYNICVNSVSPGAIERDGKKMPNMTFLGENGRSGTPEEVSELVLFLASNNFITGENIVIDGGRILGPKAK